MIPEKRVSSYIIKVSVEAGKVMLLHGYSGAIDVVDTSVADLLCEGQTVSEEGMDKALMQTLSKRGYLTDMSKEQENEYFRRMALALHKKDKLLYSSFTFVVTYDCNFRCPYCFESKLHNSESKRFAMTEEMVDKAFSAIETIRQQKQRPSKKIELFGGEPLLKENLSIIEYIVNKGIDKGFRFGAITNGYDLDAFGHLLSPDKICSLQITIDGMESMHNSKRVHKDGAPTFKKIVDNIKMALDCDVYVTVRFNTDRSNFDELNLLKEYFDGLGYTANKRFHIDSARLENYDESLDSKEKQTFLSQKEFVKKHEALDFEYGCHDYAAYGKIYRAIYRKEPLPYKSTFCSSQTGGYVFDPFFKIYPCWEVIGDKEHCIGEYSGDAPKWHEEHMEYWRNDNLTCHSACCTCKCALLCGGGCTAHNIRTKHCTHMMELIEYAAKKAYYNYKQTKS